MKLCDNEWKSVKHKLCSVAAIVVDVGGACERHDLKEEDLPTGLLLILQSLCTYVLRHSIFRRLTEDK